MSRVRTPVEITPQRLNWLAEDAVRRETVSAGESPCNLRFAGRCSEIAGRAILLLPSFLMISRILEGRPPDQGAGRIFWYRREEQRGIANGGRVGGFWRAPGKGAVRWAQIRRDHAGLGIRNQRI